ncbi:MAG: MOSC domain-containing protein [Rhizobiales bacterium]|nr:MOSC domain-containing protein [Hyphomicrobiales bacterium]
MSQTTIAELYTYPVKGLTGARHDQIALTAADCLPYDRAWAIEAGSRKFDPANPSYFPKANFLMLMRDEKLAALDTNFDAESKVLTVFRGGKQVARGCLEDKLGCQLLEQFFAAYAKESLHGGAPKIVSADNHSFSDIPNKWVSIINLASVKDLERVARKPVHPLRFRGNIYLEGLDAWDEFNWLDRTLTIGGAPVLEVTERIKRCAAINVDPETGARDLSLPRTLDIGFGHQDCGIYARVVADGQIAVGDEVVVTD